MFACGFCYVPIGEKVRKMTTKLYVGNLSFETSKEEGAAAIQQFNGVEVGGRALNVNEAKPREDRNGGGGGGRRNGSSRY